MRILVSVNISLSSYDGVICADAGVRSCNRRFSFISWESDQSARSEIKEGSSCEDTLWCILKTHHPQGLCSRILCSAASCLDYSVSSSLVYCDFLRWRDLRSNNRMYVRKLTSLSDGYPEL